MTDSAAGNGRSLWHSLGLGERLAGAGCLLMLVSLFPTWMGANLYYTGCTACTAPGGHKNGFAGIGILVVLVLLATVAFLVVRSFAPAALPAGAKMDGLVYLVAGIVELVCVFVYYAEFHTVSTGGARSPSVGLFGAAIAALLTVAGGLVVRLRAPGPVSTGPAADPYLASTGETAPQQPGADPYGADPYGAGQ
jgi:hypothetical protein